MNPQNQELQNQTSQEKQVDSTFNDYCTKCCKNCNKLGNIEINIPKPEKAYFRSLSSRSLVCFDDESEVQETKTFKNFCDVCKYYKTYVHFNCIHYESYSKNPWIRDNVKQVGRCNVCEHFKRKDCPLLNESDEAYAFFRRLLITMNIKLHVPEETKRKMESLNNMESNLLC
jgi:hypothetical protein